MKKKKIMLTTIMILILVIATIGFTYAVFTYVGNGQIENTLETGTVMLTYTEGKTGITLNEAYPMLDEAGKLLTGENNVFDFTVQATLGKSMTINYEVTAVKIPITDMTPLEDDEVKLYLERAISPETDYSEVLAPSHFIPSTEQSSLGSPIGSMIIDRGIFVNQGITIHNYRLRLWVDENAEIPNGETRKYGIKVNVYAKQDVYVAPSDEQNKNIVAVYKYDQENDVTKCITGEEETCVKIEAPETYPSGTIVKYKVNDQEEKYFHVIKDNGNILTLQQRENIVDAVAWYLSANDNTKGPLTSLETLENTTNSWSNVLDQSYTLGVTVFQDNAFTGCNTSLICLDNLYTLNKRTTKARLITVQEAKTLGCIHSTDQTCPTWMNNYLSNSTSYGGTVNGTGLGYWTLSSSITNSKDAWGVYYNGSMRGNYSSNTNFGIRAVININKYQ